MKYSDKFSNKLNDLLIINYDVEKIYLEAFKSVLNETSKQFFKERQIKRHEFGAALKNEIAKLNIVPKTVSVLNKYIHKTEKKNDINLFKNEDYLLFEVFKLQKESIDKYDELLRENSLPLSLCKILVKQRDDIQATMRVLERENVFIA